MTENLLKQQFKVYEPNKVWVSDITYVPTDEGWLYLAGHKDLFNGEIVGYAMGERMSRNLIGQSLSRGPPGDLRRGCCTTPTVAASTAVTSTGV